MYELSQKDVILRNVYYIDLYHVLRKLRNKICSIRFEREFFFPFFTCFKYTKINQLITKVHIKTK